FARLVGATPLQVELTLVRVSSHQPKNTPEEHLIDFYQTWDEVRERKFDGFIITGAPIELLAFDEVSYWRELQAILDWTTTHAHSSFLVCWGAMAAMYHFHGVPKHALRKKAFGVYRHRNLNPASPYLNGFSDDFSIPVSRWTEMKGEEIRPHENLEILMESDVTGPCLVHETFANRLYIFNHIEYDSFSLGEEYGRDIAAGTPIDMPENYFPGDDPQRPPLNRWRSHAHLLVGNWINQTYQSTPFDLADIGKGR
ncbi:MAG: homoserine O-succinyltransferase, partial [Pseudomonadota bacterium]|nr:homoserine O-succinyltransferase [Pseudomonadota bacterium]